jgi:hypothetical protein
LKKSKRQKRKPEYQQGREATKAFERAMKALFRVPKADSKERDKS